MGMLTMGIETELFQGSYGDNQYSRLVGYSESF